MAHISGLGAFFIIIIFLVVFGICAWVIYTHIRARRLGLPRPTLSSYNPFSGSSTSHGGGGGGVGGVGAWISEKVKALRNRNNRSSAGAYEEPLGGSARGRGNNHRGFGPLDPDDAWDARVGTEADAYGPGGYYEEQELGLHPGPPLAPTPGSRGRSLSREPEPYTGAAKPMPNPFGDEAEVSNVSLRGVSPRPIETGGASSGKKHDSADSPSERRSMFRENMD